MKRSSGRILTTHVGSLPRPDLAGMIFAGAQTGTAEQRAAFEARVASAVKEVVDKQIAAGVDIVSDGEQGEHPEAVAERIKNFAGIVGPERVIASTDCGFGTFNGSGATGLRQAQDVSGRRGAGFEGFVQSSADRDEPGFA